MPSPFCLCVYAPIQSDLFAINMRKPLKSAWTFDDWDDFDVNYSEQDVAIADEATPYTAAVYMRNLRAAGRQTRGWHFAQDPKTRYLTMILPRWASDWPRILLGLNILRQVLPTSGDGQPGYILAHQFGRGGGTTVGSILLRHGHSKVAGPQQEITKKIIAHASPMAARVSAMSKMPTAHIVDELDFLSEASQHA